MGEKTVAREQVRRDAEQMTVAEAVAELQRLEGQQATIEHALGEPTRRGEALRVVLAELEKAERELDELLGGRLAEEVRQAHARLAKVPALVEALKDARASVDTGFTFTTMQKIDAALAVWEQDG